MLMGNRFPSDSLSICCPLVLSPRTLTYFDQTSTFDFLLADGFSAVVSHFAWQRPETRRKTRLKSRLTICYMLSGHAWF